MQQFAYVMHWITAQFLVGVCTAVSPDLNLDMSTWEGWLNTQLVWATKEPWTFLSYVLMLLTPCFCISAVLSWKLGKQIESQQERRRKGVKVN